MSIWGGITGGLLGFVVLGPIGALVGSVIASGGSLAYLYLTIKGKVKPNKITWFFWGLFPLIAFSAQIYQGVGLVAWATFAAGAAPFLVLIASSFVPQLHKIG